MVDKTSPVFLRMREQLDALVRQRVTPAEVSAYQHELDKERAQFLRPFAEGRTLVEAVDAILEAAREGNAQARNFVLVVYEEAGPPPTALAG